MRRTHKALEEAEIILFVLDGSIVQGNIQLLNDNRAIYILNKSDLGIIPENKALVNEREYIELSALRGDNLELLIEALEKRLGRADNDFPIIGNTRQQEMIALLLGNIRKAIEQIKSYPELAAEELKKGIDTICQLKSSKTPDILNSIFKSFCIGK